MAKLARSAPVLQVRDVMKSAEFYTDKLGFTSANMWGEPPCFCIVGRETVTLFLDQQRADGSLPTNQYWAAYVYVNDVDGYLADVKGRGVEILRGPENTGYGCREFDVRDIDGHIVCFGQDLVPGKDGPGL